MRIFHIVQKRAPFIYLTFCLYGSGPIVEPVKLLIMMILLFIFFLFIKASCQSIVPGKKKKSCVGLIVR